MRSSRTVILAATLLLVAWSNGLLAQTTWIVDTGGEPSGGIASANCTAGQCTLRDAINASASGDTIAFANAVDGQTIALTLYSNDLGGTEFGPSAFFITGNKTLTIDGVTGLAQGITIARSSAGGTANFRLFDVDSGSSLTISGVTLSNGYAKGGDALGTTYSGGGALGAGGAIFNHGTLTIDRCTFSGNSAQGGNVSSGSGTSNGGGGVGQDSLTDGSGNAGGPNGGAGHFAGAGGAGGFGGGGGGSVTGAGGAGGFGGGGGNGIPGGAGGFGGGGGGNFFSKSGGIGGFGGGSVNGTTGYGGAGAGMGGAIFNDAGTVSITNSTFRSNTANGGTSFASSLSGGAGFGGALFNYNGTLSLNFVTIGENHTQAGAGGQSDGGAIYSHGDGVGVSLNMQNSIAAYTILTHDVVVDGTSGLSLGSDIVESALYYGIPSSGPDPHVVFGSYGGLTKTFYPQVFPVFSPAVDAATGCLLIDQRGVRRPEGTACDIGAVEAVIPCHVKADATGANNGETWADAFTNLQSAFGGSISRCSEVWVAAGTYKPSTSNNRSATFMIDLSVSQKVYGGFAGTEFDAGQRNPTLNRTILSGDIGIVGDNSDNSYHVVTINGTGPNVVVDSSTVLDGFIITGGNANGGGGDDNGGALYCAGSGNGHMCSPMLSNLAFVDNHAAGGGGAVYSDGSNGGNSSPTFNAITFSYNSADGAGGALYNYASGGTSSPTLTNVTFSANSSVFGGGMVSNANVTGSSSSPSLTNVTFSGNHSSGGGGAFDAYGCNSAPGVSLATLTNVIMWGDTGPSGVEEIDFQCYTPLYKNSVLQGSGGSGAWNAAFGTDGGGNIDANPLLGALQYNGGVAVAQTMMPAPGSSAIDTGSDANCTSNDERDVARPAGAHCDIGAVERLTPEDNIYNNGFDFY